jgi:hypothetical protein
MGVATTKKSVHGKDQNYGVLVAFQMECWLRVATCVFMSGRERALDRRNFLRLIVKHLSAAKERGFSHASLIQSPRQDVSAWEHSR